MKIVDCFIFYNELKMLEFRLEYLYNTVDHFVLVEATTTHAGNPKPLFFQDNKERFSKYLDKIVHVIVEDMPTTLPITKSLLSFRKMPQTSIELPLLREIHQRNCISRGIEHLKLSMRDIIMISDVDEIPDRNTLRNMPLGIQDFKVYALVQKLYYYNLTTFCENPWGYMKVVNYKTYSTNNNTAQKLRLGKSDVFIFNGGWHFSYFGDATAISNKLKNFHHQEYNTEEYTDIKKIEERVRSGSAVTGEKTIYIPVESNDYLPDNYEFLM